VTLNDPPILSPHTAEAIPQQVSSRLMSGASVGVVKADPISDHTAGVLQGFEPMPMHTLLFDVRTTRSVPARPKTRKAST
jgi:hypothetical protein